jgi:hypothetical protein
MARNDVVVVENLLRNVAKGEFSGNYMTAAVKNQSTKRKDSFFSQNNGRKRGVSPKRHQTALDRENPFDPYARKKSTKMN